MPERDTKHVAPAPECRIGKIVIKREARSVVERFLEGASPRRLARDNGLSRAGVEELIRQHARLRASRR